MFSDAARSVPTAQTEWKFFVYKDSFLFVTNCPPETGATRSIATEGVDNILHLSPFSFLLSPFSFLLLLLQFRILNAGVVDGLELGFQDLLGIFYILEGDGRILEMALRHLTVHNLVDKF